MGLENCIEFGSSDRKYGRYTEHILYLFERCAVRTPVHIYESTVENHTNLIQVQ